MPVVGTGSASFVCGKRGRTRILGFTGVSVALFFVSFEGASEPELLLGAKACFLNDPLDPVASRRTLPDDLRETAED
jgi:hypothetical protein